MPISASPLLGIIRGLQQFVRPGPSWHAGAPAAARPGGQRCGWSGPGSISGAVRQTPDTHAGGKPRVFLPKPRCRPGGANEPYYDVKTLTVLQKCRIESCRWLPQKNRRTMRSEVHLRAHVPRQAPMWIALRWFLVSRYQSALLESRSKQEATAASYHQKTQNKTKAGKRREWQWNLFSGKGVFTLLLHCLWQKGYPNSIAPHSSVALLTQRRATAVAAWFYVKQKIWSRTEAGSLTPLIFFFI